VAGTVTAAVLATAGVAAAGVATAAGAGDQLDSTVAVPADMTAGFVVFDRRTHRVTVQHNTHKQFRSASLVKILIALDYLDAGGPDAEIPAADRSLLESMLRSSDDDAASAFWARDGGSDIVKRMIAKLDLKESAPPPPDYPGWWGYTAFTASDVVKVYRYLLDRAEPAYRAFIMGNLRQSTRCAIDGRDQSFGIPSAARRPWAVKQGWSHFPDPVPADERCTPAPTRSAARNPAPDRIGQDAPNPPPSVRVAGNAAGNGAGNTTGNTTGNAAGNDLDLTRRAMHTSGTIGVGDRTILVVLTLQGLETPWNESAARVTALTRALLR
jgi:hypothetical protein